MKTSIQPIFKWTGSKQRMLAQYAPHFFPKSDFTRFVDLFAGGLTNSLWVYEHYPDKEYVLNDFNGEILVSISHYLMTLMVLLILGVSVYLRGYH